jgi:hypothetical protein
MLRWISGIERRNKVIHSKAGMTFTEKELKESHMKIN